MSNSLNLGQDRHFVGPDLGPNYFQRHQNSLLACKELIHEYSKINTTTDYGILVCIAYASSKGSGKSAQTACPDPEGGTGGPDPHPLQNHKSRVS